MNKLLVRVVTSEERVGMVKRKCVDLYGGDVLKSQTLYLGAMWTFPMKIALLIFNLQIVESPMAMFMEN